MGDRREFVVVSKVLAEIVVLGYEGTLKSWRKSYGNITNKTCGLPCAASVTKFQQILIWFTTCKSSLQFIMMLSERLATDELLVRVHTKFQMLSCVLALFTLNYIFQSINSKQDLSIYIWPVLFMV